MQNPSVNAGGTAPARLDFDLIKRLALGHWTDILAAAGLPRDALSKRHKPCPLCGGTDRFSFKDRDGRGTWICNQHRPQGGDGFHLLADWLHTDFIGAMRFCGDYLRVPSMTGPAPAPRQAEPPPPSLTGSDPRKQRATARRIHALWREGLPLTADCPAGRYLAARGLVLEAFPSVLRWHPALPYWSPVEGMGPVKLGEFPALLAAIQDPTGRCIALHQTYLTDDGRKACVPAVKKWTATAGSANGAAVRLFAPDHRLALTEGIETALAVHQVNGWPVWAGISAWGLEHVVLPGEVREVLIAADHDEAGQRAAERLAARLVAEGRTVRLLAPSTPGMDWLDVLNDER